MSEPRSSPPRAEGRTPRARRRLRWSIVLVVLSLAVVLAWLPVQRHLEAAALLLRFESPDESPEGLAAYGLHDVEERSLRLPTPDGPVAARSYVPRGVDEPPGIVLVHGVHAEGIEEPRLRSFARVLASAGLHVLTPQIGPLAEYRMTPEVVDAIGEATVAYARRIGRQRVGVLGISFSGGLALLSAVRDRYADHMTFVFAVGAHHDLRRVLRWYATETVEGPDGGRPATEPHPYGAGVFIYTQLDAFFAPEDRETAERALELLLRGRGPQARRLVDDLSPQGRRTLSRILDHDPDPPLKERFLQRIDGQREQLSRVSPRGQLHDLKVPVFLLHGEGDPVVPSTETRWLAREVPPARLEAVVVSPFLRHAEQEQAPTWRERWALVRLMAQLLSAARGAAPA